MVRLLCEARADPDRGKPRAVLPNRAFAGSRAEAEGEPETEAELRAKAEQGDVAWQEMVASWGHRSTGRAPVRGPQHR